MESILKPKQPTGKGWIQLANPPLWATLGYAGETWEFPEQGLSVISALEVVNDQNDIDKGPEYHISISKRGNRCSRNEARFVLKAFKMQDSDEDNHVPNGFVRNFWMPVAEKFVGHICPCKEEETAMIENKGDFIWRGINHSNASG